MMVVVVRMKLPDGSAALLRFQRSRQFTGTRDICRVLNLGGAIGLHSLFRALVPLRQKTASCVCQTLHALLVALAFHKQRQPQELNRDHGKIHRKHGTPADV